jgi:hypothetical protein
VLSELDKIEKELGSLLLAAGPQLKVRERKTNISDRLCAFLEELTKGNTLWNKEMTRLSEKDKEIIPQVCVPQTGFPRLLIASSSSPSYQMLTQLSRCRLPWLPSKLSIISVVAVAISLSHCFDTSSNFP